MGLPIIGLIVKATSNGIGLAAEVRAAKKQHKQTSLQCVGEPSQIRHVDICTVEDTPPSYGEAMLDSEESSSDHFTVHEKDVLCTESPDYHSHEDLSLPQGFTDDRLRHVARDQREYGRDTPSTVQYFAGSVLSECSTSVINSVRLPAPVIIPQRRPGDQDRGFMRAYAPCLSESGISQDLFLCFLKTLDSATSASPILNVMSLVSSPLGQLPITSGIRNMTIRTAMNWQKQRRTTAFLEEMNEKLFKPRGLHAVIISCKTEADQLSRISERDTKAASTPIELLHQGDMELPAAAPLVFPTDHHAQSNGLSSPSCWKQNQKHLSDYYDRRAQVAYVRPVSSTIAPFC